MKYIKTYDSLIRKYSDYELPKEGDYILIHIYDLDKNFNNFINNTIGKVADIELDENRVASVLVSYDNVPQNIEEAFMYDEETFREHSFTKGDFQFRSDPDGYRITTRYEIEFFSPNKEEVEIYLASKKYNL